jgi:hypothetical protein
MKLFRCDHCSNVIYFENTVCESCGHTLGYWHETNMMVSLELAQSGDHFIAPALPGKQLVYCANAQHGACNWLVAYNPGGDPFCRACRHNALVPDIADPANLARWQIIERAKKRLFYSLLRFNLPLATRNEDAVHGLSFQFLNEDVAPIVTGHDNGVITLALKEADDAEREYRRTRFKEPYRTLLGHFRHETGHHFWDLLIAGQPAHEDFRRLFGDESADYPAALQAYYDRGAPPDWQETHISAYATAHPWEDWAETWAHYLHIVDTTEMASAFGVRLNPRIDVAGDLKTRIDFDPYRLGDIAELIEHWVPLSSLINNLNRAVGQHDAYPFVLTPAAIGKLEFIQRVVRQAGQTRWTVSGPNGPEPINRPWQAI